MLVFKAVESVLSLLILIGVGAYITTKPWFGRAGMNVISKFTVKVAIPCYMFYNVVSTFDDPQELLKLLSNLPIPFCTMIVSLLLGLGLSKVFHIEKGKRGVFINGVAFSNTVIIGFPVVTSLFGEQATPDAMIYYMANTILFWTVGTYLLRGDGGQKEKLFSWQGLKGIFSPAIVAFLLGMAVVFTGIPVPNFIFTPITLLKNTVTAIAMVFIGGVMVTADRSKIRMSKELAIVLVMRFIVTPLTMGAVCMVLPLTLQMKEVFFVLSTMPAMTQLGIMAKESDSDYEFAAVLVTVTTAVSLVAIPVYMFIISNIF